MLPGIKEDDTSVFASFNPKSRIGLLHSSHLLKKKIKQLRAGPKIKIPDALKKYRKMKLEQSKEKGVNTFPCIQTVLDRFKSLSTSPDKRKTCSYFSSSLNEEVSQPKSACVKYKHNTIY